MDSDLIARWNSRVSKEDTVYFLGDFAFATPERILDLLGMLKFKHLYIVPGNHDKNLKKVVRYPVSGNNVFMNITLLDQIHEFEIDNQHFVLCHFPIEEWHKKEKGSVHLHGHTHKKFDAQREALIKEGACFPRMNTYDIGVEMYGGPVEITADLKHLNNPKGWSV